MKQESNMSELESLRVISSMIEKAKSSYHDKGIASIIWGTVITICSLSTWAQVHYNYSLPFDIWLLTIAAIVPTVFLSIKENRKRKIKSYDQTPMDAVWLCFGIGIFLVVHTNIAVGNAFGSLKNSFEQAGHQRPEIYFREYSSAYMLLLYGIPTLVTAAIKNFKPMLYGGIVCWISAIAVIYIPFEMDMILMAISAITAWLIPGIILHRMCRKKRKEGHV